jgi:hypothetical protein
VVISILSALKSSVMTFKFLDIPPDAKGITKAKCKQNSSSYIPGSSAAVE